MKNAAKRTVLLIRPQAAAEASLRHYQARGHHVALCPLLEILPLPELTQKDLSDAPPQGLIVTSANAVPAMRRWDTFKELPCFTVGKTTAKALKDACYHDIHEGPGTAETLFEMILNSEENGPFWHCAGQNIAFDFSEKLAARGIACRHVPLYHAQPREDFALRLKGIIEGQDVAAVTFYSPRSAKLFTEITQQAVPGALRDMAAICISSKAAMALHVEDWRICQTAKTPNENAILDALDGVLKRQIGSVL